MNGVSDAISVPTRSDGQNGGQGQGDERAWRNGCSGARKKDRSMGYSSRPYKTCNEAHQVNGVYNKMSGPTKMARANKDKGEAMDALGAMVVAVPVVRAAVWVLKETQNKQGSEWTVDQRGPGPSTRPVYGL